MERTIMMTTSLQQLLPPCPNCDRLHHQLAQLNGLLIDAQQDTQHSNLVIEQITTELLKLRDQYKQLKEKVNKTSISHEEQFSQNAIITRQLQICRNQLKKYEQNGSKHMAETSESFRGESAKQVEREVQLCIQQQKVATLQQTNKELTSEIFKLKEYLSRRSNIQKRRHDLIQAL